MGQRNELIHLSPFLTGCKKPVSASGKEMDWAQMACHRCLVYLGDLCKNRNLSFSLFWATGQVKAASAVGPTLDVIREQEEELGLCQGFLPSLTMWPSFPLLFHEPERISNTGRRKIYEL